MANLFFPQLSSGALAQYPIRKTRCVRTIKNLLPDGNMVLYSDVDGAYLVWQLEYIDLSVADLQGLQAHFANCAGPFRAFTFIDPTDNMLSYAADLTNAVWNVPASLAVAAGATDPNGNTAAFVVTNNGQVNQGVSQTLPVPAAYQYCFSVYVASQQGASITLSLSGPSATVSQTFAATSAWTRLVLPAELSDPGLTISVGLTVGAGQQANVYGPQVEAQISPSRFRPTLVQGGVYSNAHWGVDQFITTATAPGQFATTFTIEATL